MASFGRVQRDFCAKPSRVCVTHFGARFPMHAPTEDGSSPSAGESSTFVSRAAFSEAYYAAFQACRHLYSSSMSPGCLQLLRSALELRIETTVHIGLPPLEREVAEVCRTVGLDLAAMVERVLEDGDQGPAADEEELIEYGQDVEEEEEQQEARGTVAESSPAARVRAVMTVGYAVHVLPGLLGGGRERFNPEWFRFNYEMALSAREAGLSASCAAALGRLMVLGADSGEGRDEARAAATESRDAQSGWRSQAEAAFGPCAAEIDETGRTVDRPSPEK